MKEKKEGRKEGRKDREKDGWKEENDLEALISN